MMTETLLESFNNFIQLLNSEWQIYREIYQLEQRKKVELTEKTLVDLQPINDELEPLLRKAFVVEQNRIRTLQPILKHFHLDTSTTLSELMERLPAAQREELETIYQPFLSLLQELKEMNELNNHILHDNIKLLQLTVNTITGERDYEIDYSDQLRFRKKTAPSIKINTMV